MAARGRHPLRLAPMDVRPATVEDADAIARVHTRGWHVAYADVFPRDRLFEWQSDVERWRSRLSHPTPRAAAFVAEHGGRVVGFATCGPNRDEPPVGELYAIYVEPESWGAGAGRALIARIEHALLDAGFGEATLWVLAQNERARRFYERAGWHDDRGRQQERFLETDVTEVRYRKRFE